ncbi:aryl-alcohol dehydrogenase AAD14 [Calocera viscosa TUFC12733]|uniref:Aryl-alcohol dehydrogenase AAD14 n=1 Tax=Calocera viscosa (strain TUFC12733) TaxID=1330018 RepID=A0A167MLT4_CALVF|nr:aryl-alcohol dehydrogenase AAD14 [Calocera viscosa TUFC12733]
MPTLEEMERSLWGPAPAGKTPLGEYRLLSPSAGVRVSPLALGGMSLGNAWAGYFGGGMTKEQVFDLLDRYYDAGGNFIDTANSYQDEQSEKWIGEWMAARKNRDQIVLATKYSTGYIDRRDDIPIKLNYTGNSAKSMKLSLRDSLAKLQTDYVDILYVHWWDYSTPVDEIMHALDALVRSGKVLYLGISDTPAWVVTKANEYARARGLSRFIVYQGRWNVLLRDFERDILPMCKAEGMGICPWGVVGQGKFRTQAQLEERRKQGNLRGGADLTEDEKKISAALEQVSNEIGQPGNVTGVAIGYAMHKQAYVFPLIGASKVKYLLENIEAVKIKLTPDQIQFLESAVHFELGFPHNFIGPDPALTRNGWST